MGPLIRLVVYNGYGVPFTVIWKLSRPASHWYDNDNGIIQVTELGGTWKGGQKWGRKDGVGVLGRRDGKVKKENIFKSKIFKEGLIVKRQAGQI